MSEPASTSLLDHFAGLNDPRQTAKVLYPLPEILLLLLSATLAGADDCVEIEFWGKEQLAFLRRFLPYKHGIPSHDTLTGVLAERLALKGPWSRSTPSARRTRSPGPSWSVVVTICWP
jgi:DDE_Tnp_1-associated